MRSSSDTWARSPGNGRSPSEQTPPAAGVERSWTLKLTHGVRHPLNMLLHSGVHSRSFGTTTTHPPTYQTCQLIPGACKAGQRTSRVPLTHIQEHRHHTSFSILSRYMLTEVSWSTWWTFLVFWLHRCSACTWQASSPPSSFPAQNMEGLILPR